MNIDITIKKSIELIRNGKLKPALELLNIANSINHNNPRILHALGVTQIAIGDNSSGIENIKTSIALGGATVPAYLNLAHGMIKNGDPVGAKKAAHCAINIDPTQRSAYLKIAEACRIDRDYSYASDILEHGRKIFDNDPDYLATLADIYHFTGRPQDAIIACQAAIAYDNCHAGAWINLGNAHLMLGNIDSAIAAFDKAVTIDPTNDTARFNRGYARLRGGDYSQGFADYEYRKFGVKVKRPRTIDEIAGKVILVYQDQFSGDMFHYARYLSVIQAMNCPLIIQAPTPLCTTMKACYSDQIVYIPDGAARPPHDIAVGVGSLPHFLWDIAGFAANCLPYMQAPPQLINQIRDRLGPKTTLRVGINWQGNPAYGLDHFRSVTADHLRPLAAVSDRVTFYSLHGGGGPLTTPPIPLIPLAVDIATPGNFTGTAALMSVLDIVISSDTATAHLAGALGRPLWVMASAYPEWRWADSRDTSKWYPTARVYRQEQLGNWEELASKIASDIYQENEHVTVGPVPPP